MPLEGRICGPATRADALQLSIPSALAQLQVKPCLGTQSSFICKGDGGCRALYTAWPFWPTRSQLCQTFIGNAPNLPWGRPRLCWACIANLIAPFTQSCFLLPSFFPTVAIFPHRYYYNHYPAQKLHLRICFQRNTL